MKIPDNTPGSLAPRGFRRVAPAFALFFLSPFVAEYLLGDISVSAIWLILFMAPFYGGGAILVRETARRFGRGWGTIALLAFAYGLVEEGIVIQTLFNPNYLGLHLLRQAFIPSLGISLWWSSFVLTLHTAWSISAPIAVVEAIFADRRTTPWLGKVGLGVAALLLAAGAQLNRAMTAKTDPFAASHAQLLAAWALVVAIVLVTLLWRAGRSERPGSPPAAWMVGAATLALGAAFMESHKVIHGWPAAWSNLALDLAAAGLLLAWSRRAGWTPTHTLAAAGGALLAYAVHAFTTEPIFGAKGAVALAGHCLFAAIAAGLLLLGLRKERSLAPSD